MRFADNGAQALRLSVLALLCAGAAGCASVTSLTEPVKALAQAVIAPAASTSAAPSVPSPVAASPEPDAAPVSSAVQRAFDEARRALRAGRTENAERGFRALTQSNPELGGPHANLGAIYRQAGKLPEAVAEGEKAVRANPRQPVFQNQLGISYRQHGQFTKAREAYEAAIALEPSYASPYLNLGILHDLYLADGKRALELYDKYLAMSPGGDATVTKWVADLKNRKAPPIMVSQKEKE